MKSRSLCATVAILLIAFLMPCLPAIAGNFQLSNEKLTNKSKAAAISSVKSQGLSKPIIFLNQTFSLRNNNAVLGILVSGRAVEKNESRENAICFLSFENAKGNVLIIKTIGQGNWEAESCMKVLAVGMIRSNKSKNTIRVAIVYEAASPNTLVHEPVVFLWDNAKSVLSVDKKATNKASLAGATSIQSIRQVIK